LFYLLEQVFSLSRALRPLRAIAFAR